jgi:hypothetical protein
MKSSVGRFYLNIKDKLKAKIVGAVAAFTSLCKPVLDVRLFLFLGGLIMFGYGLYQYSPWISFTVCGLILMLMGWMMGDPE